MAAIVFRYMYRYKESGGYTWQATTSCLEDTFVPLDRLEACVRGLKPWRGSEMFDGVVHS
jgi:hypothetical protein